jgi:hypothetical protein
MADLDPIESENAGELGEDAPAKTKRDRKLGDEWKDWDGHDPAATVEAGKRLFFSLTGALLILLGGLGLFAWYLIAPRLAEWHRAAPTVALAAFLTGLAALYLVYGLIAATLLLRLRLPAALSGFARRILAGIEGGVFWLGSLCGLGRDRIAHSFVQVHNALVRLSRYRLDPARLLVLLPRCLTKEQLRAANALGSEYGVVVAVAGGGEVARARIKEHQPEAVIGVACERDLLSGIRDVRGKLCVLGIPNTRPHGPCKDTLIDLETLREGIEFYLRPAPEAPRSVESSPSSSQG